MWENIGEKLVDQDWMKIFARSERRVAWAKISFQVEMGVFRKNNEDTLASNFAIIYRDQLAYERIYWKKNIYKALIL